MQREPWALLKSLLALILIVLCLWAAQWQYQRGVDRHARNFTIMKQIALLPIPLINVGSMPAQYEWQSVTISGEFEVGNQILLPNRYSEGVYGFEVLTLFTAIDGERFWVDRGWVKAGRSASTPPQVTEVPKGRVEITGRLRLDSSLPQGRYFALPANGSGLVSKLNAQSQLRTEKYYLDLLNGSDESLRPVVPAELPVFSDGPHMAYALQWIFFAGLIVYGRLLIRRAR